MVAARLDSRPPLLALRRTLTPGPTTVVSCRSPAALDRLLHDRPLDAVVLGRTALRTTNLRDLQARFPAIPLLGYGRFRPDDGELLATLLEPGFLLGVAVEGVDDAVVGELVRRRSLSRAREQILADAPRLLRLSEPIQRRAWEYLLRRMGEPISTRGLAASLSMSREHLSRQFGAGGAPTLKRVIDLLRIVCAAQLLANPGYDPAAVARLLRFASASHLSAVARRIAGVPASGLGKLGLQGVLAAFLRRALRRWGEERVGGEARGDG